MPLRAHHYKTVLVLHYIHADLSAKIHSTHSIQPHSVSYSKSCSVCLLLLLCPSLGLISAHSLYVLLAQNMPAEDMEREGGGATISVANTVIETCHVSKLRAYLFFGRMFITVFLHQETASSVMVTYYSLLI